MDIESLTPAQVDLSLKLCDILSIEDLTVAASVLSGYDWNIEVPPPTFRKPSTNCNSEACRRST
jgi:hypothetical protein